VLSPLGTQAVIVIDMNGNVVKRWEGLNNSAGGPARVLPGGVVISASGARPPYQESLELVRQDFAGNVLWKFAQTEQIKMRDGSMVWSARQHHDWQLDSFPAGYYSPESTPTADGATTLILTHTNRMQPNVADVMLEDDRLIEVSPKGEIGWTWVASDHIDELGFAPDARKAIRAANTFNKGRGSFDWLHVNSATYLGPNRWFDQGDMRFAPNHVIISSREASLLAIIDRKGAIVWRLGPDFSASRELRAIRQIIGQHHAHFIPKGLPGAGNLLVFDNGGSSGYGFNTPIAPDGVGAFARATSRVLEINPVTLELVWSYTNPRFFSTNISGAQRLPNGNTLITAGAGGRMFEVTREGAIVWEYMYPLFSGANASNAVYRAYRVPYGWIPQLTAPKEQRVTPPALGEFKVSSTAQGKTLTAAECTAERLGASVATTAIGEPVRSVTVSAPSWVDAANGVAAHCRVNGSMASIDTSGTSRPINFSVVLPASWSGRAAQLGGGGMNGVVPNLTGGGPGAQGPSLLDRGLVTYGSDSGHQAAFGQRGGGGRVGAAPGVNVSDDWTLNDEAIRNLGYMQMKKTHDAAMVIIERAYGERPRFNYYIGTSQGGREALTVAQRYPADYDGIAANVPIVGFSTLMLAPELIRIQEKPAANWVTPAKVNAIRGEFMRQCDGLDGLADGIVNNYMACRAIFDVTQGTAGRRPWAAKRCPNNVDPNPGDTSASACLTDGQISTLEFTYRRYPFQAALANGTKSFGMWVPNTDPSGSGLILSARFRGQEGAVEGAPMHAHLGVLGVTGFLMKNLSANPLDYVESGAFTQRRQELSAILDGTSPDLAAFQKRGGKMIVTIGTNDTLASPGAQLDYYQSVLDRMGRASVDQFARLFVMPQTGHGLSGANYTVDGDGRTIASAPIPNRYDQTGLLFDWVEKGVAPGMSITVTAGERSLPLCSYPAYPRYRGGASTSATSYDCVTGGPQTK
jgi:feruloyl esterase